MPNIEKVRYTVNLKLTTEEYRSRPASDSNIETAKTEVIGHE